MAFNFLLIQTYKLSINLAIRKKVFIKGQWFSDEIICYIRFVVQAVIIKFT